MTKNILIFGAAGFMGTYLTDELIKQNYHVTATDINVIGEKYYIEKKITYFNIDITHAYDFNILNDYHFDIVIHLAATQPANVSSKDYDPKNYINVNVNGTLNILEFCKKKGIKK